ncbi:hypothetical protein Mp_3g19600 [Marchantia polymorpha subsp. ruderalis]|uniref:Uncharacterized protein n=2 Tax=Marchantia polymorpha TaxID=3197 RepID=A0AAF6B2L7_MARPO|nr:hypothetical protein MARPO_0049s0074 [Marchantia polymorpha]BBN06251.1 hypothetical protein Mp_3g19600 [Marchantia polymorpha subsp. ruderalis]|eukprot:PTQ38792.1 hypothetical protein MARPO_0049s0074 [Marchantia polymorpha]
MAYAPDDRWELMVSRTHEGFQNSPKFQYLLQGHKYLPLWAFDNQLRIIISSDEPAEFGHVCVEDNLTPSSGTRMHPSTRSELRNRASLRPSASVNRHILLSTADVNRAVPQGQVIALSLGWDEQIKNVCSVVRKCAWLAGWQH